MCADRHKDDMEGLIRALDDSSQYQQIIFHFTDQFLMPPDDPEILLPHLNATKILNHVLTEVMGDDAVQDQFKDATEGALLEAAHEHSDILHHTILHQATLLAVGLLYETICSFTGGRQIVLIVGEGNEWCSGLLTFFEPATDDELNDQRVSSKKLPLTGGIQSWPIVFRRLGESAPVHELFPGPDTRLNFSWGVQFDITKPFSRCQHALHTDCQTSYPVEDSLRHPRALLAKGEQDGFLLAIPRPSNMKNFSITLRTGKGIQKEAPPPEPTGNAPTVERDWMTRAEVAEVIGKSTDTVDNYCRDGKLEFSKVGREVRITKESVQRYLGGA